jgi:hypothetical protein
MAVYGPLLVLLHEIGHATLARYGGYRVTSFGVGLGRPLWRLRLQGGVVVHVDAALFTGGACTAIPIGPPTPRRILFHGGGLAFQAVLALVLLLLPESWLVTRVAQFNILVAVVNALPWRWRGSASDGWHILQVLRGAKGGGAVLPPRDTLERLAAREVTIGSPVGVMYAELCLAWSDVLVNRSEAADAFFRRDAPESAVEPWLDAVYQYVAAECHRTLGRPLAALRTVRTTRRAIGDDLVDEAAALIAVAEARALVDLDSPAPAARALVRASGMGGPIGRQAMAVHLRIVTAENPDDLEWATWRVARHINESWLDPADVVLALFEAAAALHEQGQSTAAVGARSAAADLAKRTLSRAAVLDRDGLRARMGDAATSDSPGRLGMHR